MNNEIFIDADERMTLAEYVSIGSRMMLLIAEAAESTDEVDEVLTIVDLSTLLNKVSMHMSGEFKIRRTPSQYCQIAYEPYVFNEAELDKAYINNDFVDLHDDKRDCLWINEKVLFAFRDRKLYGTAFALYFYLGHLMTRDEAFAVSHNISFEKIIEICDAFPEGHLVKYPTTLLRAIADLQDAGLIKWNEEAGSFELLHITAYDPKRTV